MKTRHALFLLLLLPGLLTPAWADAQKGQPIKTTGTIKHQGIEGGFWGIVGDDGQNYDPANLAPEFQIEGLRVSFEAVTKPDVASFHMWGTIVDIKAIRKLEGSGSAPDSLKPVTGIAEANLTATKEAAKRVVAARGESLVVRDESTETIATKPHALEKDALLASFESQIKPEDSGYTQGTYELKIYFKPKGKRKTAVEVKAEIMAFGRAHMAMAKPDTWDPVPSNGKIEREVLMAIQAEAKKKK